MAIGNGGWTMVQPYVRVGVSPSHEILASKRRQTR